MHLTQDKDTYYGTHEYNIVISKIFVHCIEKQDTS